MPSPEYEAIVQFLKANPTPSGVPLAQQRAAMEMLAAQTPLPPNVYSEQITADSVSGLLLAAEGARDDRLLLYFHGGGYVIGSSTTHQDLAWRLSAATQARVFSLDYRLAPEHPFPAAVEDALAAYRWLLTQGFTADRLALAGDSAGGGLVMAVLVALRDAGEPLPATAVCLSPWVDLALTGKSLTTNAAADPVITRERLAEYAQLYLGETDPQIPLASPLYADLNGLPPLLIQAGSAEILLDDASRLAARAEAAGVAVTLDIWEEMIHVWQAFAAVVPESQEAIARIGEFVRQYL
ncbi:MAG: alpha/beta hydrolase [Chloroflexi bacterium]|nr:MAG: alpha/beta hydrolase [Chloroflexota bacterium]